MLPVPVGKLWLYHEPVDLRKSYRSLCAVVEYELKLNKQSGAGYIFVNKQKTLAKVLWWDRTGWCLLLKRLSAGRYRISGKSEVKELFVEHVRIFFDGL